ncbi:MAG: NAD-dependent epimerase/dehydratase family protein [Dehalococcoidales bacterium]|nr:NAD-dependent epimerase/dehydratase family protein [Dehalococcoidales bacterium]
MNVLVTGGAGFIGSHTVNLLLSKGHNVRVIDSLYPRIHPQGRKPSYLSDEAEFILGDVCSPSDMEHALQGIDVVYHLAAHQDYLTDFSTFAFVNDGGTALLYEIIVKGRLPVRKVILASSQSVYGEGRYYCPQHGIQHPLPRPLSQLALGRWDIRCEKCHSRMEPLLTDESVTEPHNHYAVSKYCQELYALTLGRRYNIPTVVLRYSITQGKHQSYHNAYSGILRNLTLSLLNDSPPIIYEDGQQLRDYVYVSDVARANLLVMEKEAADYNIYNVGGNQPFTVLEYLRIVQNVAGKYIPPVIRGEFRFGDNRNCISDSSKLRELGWQPDTRLDLIVQEYIAWVKEQAEFSLGDHTNAYRNMRETGVIREAVARR